MNIYHGKYEEPPLSTRKRRRIIESDDSDVCEELGRIFPQLLFFLESKATKRQFESIACEQLEYYF